MKKGNFTFFCFFTVSPFLSVPTPPRDLKLNHTKQNSPSCGLHQRTTYPWTMSPWPIPLKNKQALSILKKKNKQASLLCFSIVAFVYFVILFIFFFFSFWSSTNFFFCLLIHTKTQFIAFKGGTSLRLGGLGSPKLQGFFFFFFLKKNPWKKII
jgi:hypothetical protein